MCSYMNILGRQPLFLVDKEAQVWFRKVATVSPYNLASHSIRGFKESCSVYGYTGNVWQHKNLLQLCESLTTCLSVHMDLTT